jgi:hypothetical protein
MNLVDRSYEIKSRYFTAPRNGFYHFYFMLYTSKEMLRATFYIALMKNGDHILDLIPTIYRDCHPDRLYITGGVNMKLLSNETERICITIDDGITPIIPCEFEDNIVFNGMLTFYL